MKELLKLIKRESLEENYPLTISSNGFELDIEDNKLKEKIIKLIKDEKI